MAKKNNKIYKRRLELRLTLGQFHFLKQARIGNHMSVSAQIRAMIDKARKEESC